MLKLLLIITVYVSAPEHIRGRHGVLLPRPSVTATIERIAGICAAGAAAGSGFGRCESAEIVEDDIFRVVVVEQQRIISGARPTSPPQAAILTDDIRPEPPSQVEITRSPAGAVRIMDSYENPKDSGQSDSQSGPPGSVSSHARSYVAEIRVEYFSA